MNNIYNCKTNREGEDQACLTSNIYNYENWKNLLNNK